MLWTLLFLALGLSADATAVSLAAGVTSSRVRDALLLAVCFGAAQGLMPVLGWAVGSRFADAIEAWDHWVVLVLLGGIGGKMVFDGLKSSGTPEPRPFAARTVALMSLATSIDALAAGVTLPLLNVHIATAAAVIGGVTFAFCFVGVLLGQRLGTRFGPKLTVIGGLILIGLGLKTAVEHVVGRAAG